MSWFRKKGPTESEVRAYRMGQDAGGEMATAFKVYQEKRFGPVHERYLGVLRDSLQAAIKKEDDPPHGVERGIAGLKTSVTQRVADLAWKATGVTSVMVC